MMAPGPLQPTVVGSRDPASAALRVGCGRRIFLPDPRTTGPAGDGGALFRSSIPRKPGLDALLQIRS